MGGVSLSLITTFFLNKSKISPVRTHQDTMVTIAIEMLDLERNKVISILFPATCVQQPKLNLCWPGDRKGTPVPTVLPTLCSRT